MPSRLAARTGALLVLVSTCAALLAPGSALAAHAVVGGARASAGPLDFAAFVIAKSRGGYGTCTGSVIAPNVVLTAAHCVIDPKTDEPLAPSAFEVITGSIDLENRTARQESRVTTVAVAPGFRFSTLRPDDAILVLGTPTTAPAIAIATSADTALYTPGASVVLAGWGLTNDASRATPAVLHSTTTELQNNAACNVSASGIPLRFAIGYMICTAGGGIACKGDSGGPIIEATVPTPASLSDWRLIGTTSWGDDTCNYLSVGANVLPSSAWIAQQVAFASGAPAAPAVPVTKISTPLGAALAPPAEPVALRLHLHLVGHGRTWFRLRVLAGPSTPIDRLHVRLQYYTGYGYKAFASLTVVSGRPTTQVFSGEKGRYTLRAVVDPGPAWTAATSTRTAFTLR